MRFKVYAKPGTGTGLYEIIDEQTGPVAEPNQFLKALQIRGLSPRTIRAYAYDLVVFDRWLATTDKELHTLRQPDLLAFVDAQRKASANPNSINRRLTTCRLLCRFCTDKEMDSGPGFSAPAPYYRGRGKDRYLGLHQLRPSGRNNLRVKTPRKVIEPLTAKEVRLFLRSLRRYRDVAIVHLILLCGLRSREVLYLKLSDVSLDERRLRIQGKGDKERVLPLPELVLQPLNDYLQLERPVRCPKPRLFVVLKGPTRGQPMTTAGLRSLFRHRRLNPDLARANPHRFRHTFGADMARAGVRLPILQTMMGHAHATTTLGYINLSMADIAEEYQRAARQIEKRYHGRGPAV